MPAVNSLASAVGRRAGRRTAKRSSQVAGERCHMLTRSRAEWPRFCVQPWLGAFSLRAGSRAEERGSRHRLIFLTCTCLNPTLQEAREQPLIERPRWSFFHFPPDFLNELLSVSRPLSQLWTLPSAFTWGGGERIHVLITAGGVNVLILLWILSLKVVFVFEHHEDVSNVRRLKGVKSKKNKCS